MWRLTMCDIVPGQLIVCFPRGDAIGAELIAQIRDNEIEHVSYVESLDERLHAMALPIDTTLKYSLHLLEVPPGSEMWKITFLHFHYKQFLLGVLQETGGKLPATQGE